MSKRHNPAAQEAERREFLAQIESEEPLLGMMPLTPGDLTSLGRALGYGANVASKLHAIYEAGGIAKAGAAAVDEAALLFKGTGRSLKQAYGEFSRGAKRLVSGKAPISEGSASASVAPRPSPAKLARIEAEHIEKVAATPKSQSQVMREAAQAKRDLMNPPSQRTLQARKLEAARNAAAEDARKAELRRAVSMRSKPNDPLNNPTNLPLKEEIAQGNYRGHKPPPFDEPEIARGTESTRAFKKMKARHHPSRVSDPLPTGKDNVSGKPVGGANTGGNNVARDLSEETFGNDAARAREVAGQRKLQAELRRIEKSELKPKE